MDKVQKIKTIYILILAIAVIIFLSIRIYQLNLSYSEYEIKVINVKFTDEWLNFTIYFIKLPEQGAEFDEIIVDGYCQSLKGITFYTGDRLTIEISHNGTIQSLPVTATLIQKEYGFVIHVTTP